MLECETEKGDQETKMVQSGNVEGSLFFLAAERRAGFLIGAATMIYLSPSNISATKYIYKENLLWRRQD